MVTNTTNVPKKSSLVRRLSQEAPKFAPVQGSGHSSSNSSASNEGLISNKSGSKPNVNFAPNLVHYSVSSGAANNNSSFTVPMSILESKSEISKSQGKLATSTSKTLGVANKKTDGSSKNGNLLSPATSTGALSKAEVAHSGSNNNLLSPATSASALSKKGASSQGSINTILRPTSASVQKLPTATQTKSSVTASAGKLASHSTSGSQLNVGHTPVRRSSLKHSQEIHRANSKQEHLSTQFLN